MKAELRAGSIPCQTVNAAALGLAADGWIYIFLVCGDTNTHV